jgi:hypothetical protein
MIRKRTAAVIGRRQYGGLAPKIKLNLLFVGKFESALGGEDIRK